MIQTDITGPIKSDMPAYQLDSDPFANRNAESIYRISYKRTEDQLGQKPSTINWQKAFEKCKTLSPVSN